MVARPRTVVFIAEPKIKSVAELCYGIGSKDVCLGRGPEYGRLDCGSKDGSLNCGTKDGCLNDLY